MPPVEQQTKSAELFDKLEPVRHIQAQTAARTRRAAAGDPGSGVQRGIVTVWAAEE
jgi:hypothetical protein